MPTLTDITSSFITDAEGHWHDLSKGAFDAFTITHPGAPATIDPEFFNQPLQQIAQKIKETGYEKLGQYKEALAAFSGAAISSAVTKYAGAEAMGTMVGGIPGAAEWHSKWESSGCSISRTTNKTPTDRASGLSYGSD